jgi:hypothetical protein
MNVRFEVLTAVRMTMLFFWVMTPFGLDSVLDKHTVPIFSPEVGIYLRVYTASQPRRTSSQPVLPVVWYVCMIE